MTFYDVSSSHELQAKLCKYAGTKKFVTCIITAINKLSNNRSFALVDC